MRISISIGMKLMERPDLVRVGLYGTWSSWRGIHEIHKGLGNAADIGHGILNFQREFKADKAAAPLRHA